MWRTEAEEEEKREEDGADDVVEEKPAADDGRYAFAGSVEDSAEEGEENIEKADAPEL